MSDQGEAMPGPSRETVRVKEASGGDAIPRLTIGLPVYNAERYLTQALDSILSQDFADFELVISDNASTDQTLAICRAYAECDPRIRVLAQSQNMGVAANFNAVVRAARGGLFRWAAYDDLLGPGLLRACVQEMDACGPNTVLAYPQTLLIDDDGAVVGRYEDNLDLRGGSPWQRVSKVAMNWNLCNPQYGVIRTSQLRRTGLQRAFVSSDVPLLYELAAIGEFHEVPDPLFLRRFHAGSSTGNSASWYQPDRPWAERFPRLRLEVRSLVVLLNMDQTLSTRLLCAGAFLLTWTYRSTRVRGGQVKAFLRHQLATRH